MAHVTSPCACGSSRECGIAVATTVEFSAKVHLPFEQVLLLTQAFEQVQVRNEMWRGGGGIYTRFCKFFIQHLGVGMGLHMTV